MTEQRIAKRSYPGRFVGLFAICVPKPPDLGQVLEEYPLHITVTPKFSIDRAHLSPLLGRIQEVVDDHGPVRAASTHIEAFGANRDIDVHRLFLKGLGIHVGAVVGLDYFGANYDRQHTLHGWKPHITPKKQGDIHIGDVFDLSALTLFERTDQGRLVVANLSPGWKNDSNEDIQNDR